MDGIDGINPTLSGCLNQSYPVPQRLYSNLLAFQMQYPDNYNPPVPALFGVLVFGFMYTESWGLLGTSLPRTQPYPTPKPFLALSWHVCLFAVVTISIPTFGFLIRTHRHLVSLMAQTHPHLLAITRDLCFGTTEAVDSDQ